MSRRLHEISVLSLSAPSTLQYNPERRIPSRNGCRAQTEAQEMFVSDQAVAIELCSAEAVGEIRSIEAQLNDPLVRQTEEEYRHEAFNVRASEAGDDLNIPACIAAECVWAAAAAAGPCSFSAHLSSIRHCGLVRSSCRHARLLPN